MRRSVLPALAVALVASSATVQAGDPIAGQAKAALCAGCHGPDGNSLVPTYPKLAGQHEAYLVNALKQYRTGARTDATMKAMSAPLSDRDIENLAAYFSNQRAR